jgi:hypothetical protein
VPAILKAQMPDGFWFKAGGGYSPKYRGTVWQVVWLAELGADGADERVRRGCEYLLGHTRASNGAFSYNQHPVPSGAVHCLNGNLVWALLRLGWGDDPRVQRAVEWIALAITGKGAIEFHAAGTAGPGFACGVNMGQPCAWGANKSIRALLEVPAERRTPLIRRALRQGAEFLLSRDPRKADYPYTQRVSSTWFKLGFPPSYWSDVLETVANLAALGYAKDRRLRHAWDWIFARQDADGRWPLQNTPSANMWAEIETKREPSKWVTLRALRAIKASGGIVVS